MSTQDININDDNANVVINESKEITDPSSKDWADTEYDDSQGKSTFYITKISEGEFSDESSDSFDDSAPLWLDSDEAKDLLDVSADRIDHINQFTDLLGIYFDSKGDRASGIFKSLSTYVKYSMDNDLYISKFLNDGVEPAAAEFIESLKKGVNNKLESIISRVKSSTPDDISRWRVSSLIATIPDSVKNDFNLTDSIITVADLINLYTSTQSTVVFNLAVKLGMQNTFNMFKGGKLFCSNIIVEGDVPAFYTHLFHEIDGQSYRVVILLNNNNPAVSHFIKLFMTFMLKFNPNSFSECTKGTYTNEDGLTTDVIYISIDLIAGYFCNALLSLKMLLKSSGLLISDFKVSKGNFCHLLASFYTENIIHISNVKEQLHHKYGLLINDSNVVIGVSVPCLHCFTPNNTNSEFIFNPDVLDPVVLATDHMYSDGNNPPVWLLNHETGLDIEKRWLKSLLFSRNYSRAYFAIRIHEVGKFKTVYPDGIDEDNIVKLNLIYPTHHSDASTSKDEHAHIRLSLFYSLDVQRLGDESIDSVLIPGHMIYFIDSIVGYIKDRYLATKNSNFHSLRDILIKRIKTNFSYLCLPESGSALVNCYKMYILLFWIQALPDISDLLCFLANCTARRVIIPQERIPTKKSYEVYNEMLSALSNANANNDLHSYLKRVVYNFLCLDLHKIYLIPENIKAIFKAKDECCSCDMCKSLGLSLSDESISKIEDVVVTHLISYLVTNDIDRLATFKELISQAESISKIIKIGVLKGKTLLSGFNNNVTICAIKYSEDKKSKCLIGFYTNNKKRKSALQIKLNSRVSKSDLDSVINMYSDSQSKDALAFTNLPNNSVGNSRQYYRSKSNKDGYRNPTNNGNYGANRNDNDGKHKNAGKGNNRYNNNRGHKNNQNQNQNNNNNDKNNGGVDKKNRYRKVNNGDSNNANNRQLEKHNVENNRSNANKYKNSDNGPRNGRDYRNNNSTYNKEKQNNTGSGRARHNKPNNMNNQRYNDSGPVQLNNANQSTNLLNQGQPNLQYFMSSSNIVFRNSVN